LSTEITVEVSLGMWTIWTPTLKISLNVLYTFSQWNIMVFVMLEWCYYVARVFHISTLSILSGLTEQQPHRAVRTTAARYKHCEKLTLCRIPACDLWIREQWTRNTKAAGSNPAWGRFFTMLISYNHCSDGFMWFPFW